MSGNGVKEGAAIVSELPKEKLLTEQKVTNNKSSVEENVSGRKDDDKESVLGGKDDDKENVSGDEDDDKENVSGRKDDDKEITFEFSISDCNCKKFRNGCEGDHPAATLEELSKLYRGLPAIEWSGVPSALQKEGWRLLMSGADLVCVAPSGAERTRVFLLPALIHLERWRTCSRCRTGPTVLILTSTRESALAIQGEVKKGARHGTDSVMLVGGEELAVTPTQLPEILICTPAGMTNMQQIRGQCLGQQRYLVLDGLVLGSGVSARGKSSPMQTVLTTAAWGEEAQEIALHHMQHPAMVNERGDLECPLAMIGGEPCTIEHGAHSLDHRDREDA